MYKFDDWHDFEMHVTSYSSLSWMTMTDWLYFKNIISLVIIKVVDKNGET